MRLNNPNNDGLKYRFSATTLESYRYWWDWAPNSAQSAREFADRLTYGFAPNNAMTAGTAFHEWLERVLSGDAESHANACSETGYTFSINSDVDIEIPRPVIQEKRFERDIDIGGEIVGITGKMDAIDIYGVQEYKTSAKPPKIERYTGSLQYRIYLWLTDLDRFDYYLFQFHEKVSDPPQHLKVIRCDTMTLYRYAGIEDDIRYWARRVADFCRSQNLVPCAKEVNKRLLIYNS